MKNCTTLKHPNSHFLGTPQRMFYSHGARVPPGMNTKETADCDAGFCVGPGYCYPTGDDIDWYAEFDVPPLPTTFDANSMTDYIYFNVGKAYDWLTSFLILHLHTFVIRYFSATAMITTTPIILHVCLSVMVMATVCLMLGHSLTLV
jgi:hypothetical protein